MTGKVKVGVAIAVLVIFVLTFGGLLWLNRPFQVELGSYRTSVAERTVAQRHNIRQAVMDLDGIVIESGETFSFNETVGPRTPERGYREAPAFMERDLVTSIGGGICQVSSTLYNAALISGLRIVERHPHFRLVTSVLPGRDATVWYGAADLKFINPYQTPVRLSVHLLDEALFAVIQSRSGIAYDAHISSVEIAASGSNGHSYKTFRAIMSNNGDIIKEVISIDSY